MTLEAEYSDRTGVDSLDGGGRMAGMGPNWRVCDFCGGDGVRTVEWNTHGEATCGTCRGTGRVMKQTALPCVGTDGPAAANDVACHATEAAAGRKQA